MTSNGIDAMDLAKEAQLREEESLTKTLTRDSWQAYERRHDD